MARTDDMEAEAFKSTRQLVTPLDQLSTVDWSFSRLRRNISDNVDSRGDSDLGIDEIELRWQPLVCFALVAVGYAGPWLMLGALVSWIKEQTQNSYYVAIYFTYYAPGFGVSMVQQRCDGRYDERFGSYASYLFRGIVCFGTAILLSLLMRSAVLVRPVMLSLTAMLGLVTWALHGSTSQLSQMVGRKAILAQQIGFMLPSLISLAAVRVLGISAHATVAAIDAYFWCITGMVVAGAVAFGALLHCHVIDLAFNIKDQKHLIKETLTCNRANSLIELRTVSEKSHEQQSTSDLASIRHGLDVKEKGHEKLQKSELDVAAKSRVAVAIRPAFQALAVTIFCSVFAAAFYPYVPSSSPEKNIAEVLYFVRSGCDLVGRSATGFKHCVVSQEQLRTAAAARTVLLVIFLCYVFVPGLPRSDVFVIVINGAFAALSGLFAVLAYSLAAKAVTGKAEQAYSGAMLNTAFQSAMFLAVVLGEVIALFLDGTGHGDSRTA